MVERRTEDGVGFVWGLDSRRGGVVGLRVRAWVRAGLGRAEGGASQGRVLFSSDRPCPIKQPAVLPDAGQAAACGDPATKNFSGLFTLAWYRRETIWWGCVRSCYTRELRQDRSATVACDGGGGRRAQAGMAKATCPCDRRKPPKSRASYKNCRDRVEAFRASLEPRSSRAIESSRDPTAWGTARQRGEPALSTDVLCSSNQHKVMERSCVYARTNSNVVLPPS